MRKKNWIGHVLRGSGDCLMRHVMEGGIEGVRSRGRPRDKMLDDSMEGSYQHKIGNFGRFGCQESVERQSTNDE